MLIITLSERIAIIYRWHDTHGTLRISKVSLVLQTRRMVIAALLNRVWIDSKGQSPRSAVLTYFEFLVERYKLLEARLEN